MNSRYTWAALLGAGAGLMFLLDPQTGNRRRALLRDKLRRFSRQAGERASAWSEMAADHAQGFVAETRARLRPEEVDDRTLVERVMTRPSSARTRDVLDHEADAALAAARTTRGVRSVEDALERHAQPGNVPSLQGGDAGQSPES